MASFWNIVQADLENRTSVSFILAAFDDGTGTVNTTALAAVIADGETEMQSWLVGELGGVIANWPSDVASDPLYKLCAEEYAIAFTVERHPEAAKQAGLGTKENYFNRAMARAKRVQEARQRATVAEEPPANVGGLTPATSPLMYTNYPGTPTNTGDF
jgi:hypothetical protein